MKKIILLLLLTLGVLSVNAQNVAISGNKLTDNWYFGVGVGAATPLSFNKVFPLNTIGHIVVGKQFDPIFGAEVEGDIWFGSNSKQLFDVNHNRITNRFDHPYAHNFVRGVGVGLFGTANITNMLYTYTKPHKAELFLKGGIDYACAFIPNRKNNNAFGVKTGTFVRFNLNDANALQLGADVLWKLSNNGHPMEFNANRSQLEVKVAYIYKFKTSNGSHNFKTYNIDAYEQKIKELQSVKPVPVKPRTVFKEVYQVKREGIWVPFAFNTATLDEEAKAYLDKVASELKENVTVKGYASYEDSSNPEYNKTLSLKRAEAVANYLKDKNVKIKDIIGLGANSKTSQRCVIIEQK